jgi:hypothetical protein
MCMIASCSEDGDDARFLFFWNPLRGIQGAGKVVWFMTKAQSSSDIQPVNWHPYRPQRKHRQSRAPPPPQLT